MWIKIFILLIIVFSISWGAYNFTPVKMYANTDIVEISDDDFNGEKKENDQGEIVIDDSDLKEIRDSIENTIESGQEVTKTQKDGSSLTIMYDGFGNQTVTRTFNNHSRLTRIIVRIDSSGNRRVFVYGYNGDVRTVPQNMLNTVLTDTPDDIANASKIYETVDDLERRKAEIAQRQKDLLKKESENYEYPAISQPGFPQTQPNNTNDTEFENGDQQQGRSKVQISNNLSQED